MGETKALTGAEAAKEIVRIAKGETAMLCTFVADGELHTRPMSTAGVDEDGTVWFMSSRGSAKNGEIAANARGQLIYAVTSKSEYLSLAGMFTIERDQAKIDELWTPIAKAWFTEGKTDPDITLLRFVPREGYYWDTKTNRVVQMAKIVVGAIVGKPFDDGVEGPLKAI
jgi:general stress protein 26